MNGYAERNLAHQPDLIVIGNAISRGNPEAEAALAQPEVQVVAIAEVDVEQPAGEARLAGDLLHVDAQPEAKSDLSLPMSHP